ncbi:MAG: ATP-binding cassette domain-containing protein [Candidatus Cloacimonetes bacterium]|nr:ATP-binding cassette domain-containing protein [Candidatus Cloacimonadota bacterium]
MNNYLEIINVCKSFRETEALKKVNLQIPKASIFGLLGPNGAGKTTLIRIINQIIGADSGKILLNGSLLKPQDISAIGYLPEERGLYPKMKVEEQLIYLSQLKGLTAREAKTKLNLWFDKFEIHDWKNKRIQELSKGMQQKIQFIATVVHNPQLIILDEPFTGLDPINTNLIKNEIRTLKAEGVTVIFSTHRMEQVEEICEIIALINKGEAILKGDVQAVKEEFKKNLFRIEFNGEYAHKENELFDVVEKSDKHLIIQAKNETRPNELLRFLINLVEVHSFNEILPSLNEIFIEKVEGKNHE